MKWSRVNARLSRRSSRKKEAPSPEFAGFCLLSLSILGLYCTAVPQHAGVAGSMLARVFSRMLGQIAFAFDKP